MQLPRRARARCRHGHLPPPPCWLTGRAATPCKPPSGFGLRTKGFGLADRAFCCLWPAHGQAPRTARHARPVTPRRCVQAHRDHEPRGGSALRPVAGAQLRGQRRQPAHARPNRRRSGADAAVPVRRRRGLHLRADAAGQPRLALGMARLCQGCWRWQLSWLLLLSTGPGKTLLPCLCRVRRRRYLVKAGRRLGLEVIDRCNLTGAGQQRKAPEAKWLLQQVVPCPNFNSKIIRNPAVGASIASQLPRTHCPPVCVVLHRDLWCVRPCAACQSSLPCQLWVHLQCCWSPGRKTWRGSWPTTAFGWSPRCHATARVSRGADLPGSVAAASGQWMCRALHLASLQAPAWLPATCNVQLAELPDWLRLAEVVQWQCHARLLCTVSAGPAAQSRACAPQARAAARASLPDVLPAVLLTCPLPRREREQAARRRRV